MYHPVEPNNVDMAGGETTSVIGLTTFRLVAQCEEFTFVA